MVHVHALLSCHRLREVFVRHCDKLAPWSLRRLRAEANPETTIETKHESSRASPTSETHAQLRRLQIGSPYASGSTDDLFVTGMTNKWERKRVSVGVERTPATVRPKPVLAAARLGAGDGKVAQTVPSTSMLEDLELGLQRSLPGASFGGGTQLRAFASRPLPSGAMAWRKKSVPAQP